MIQTAHRNNVSQSSTHLVITQNIVSDIQSELKQEHDIAYPKIQEIELLIKRFKFSPIFYLGVMVQEGLLLKTREYNYNFLLPILYSRTSIIRAARDRADAG